MKKYIGNRNIHDLIVCKRSEPYILVALEGCPFGHPKRWAWRAFTQVTFRKEVHNLLLFRYFSLICNLANERFSFFSTVCICTVKYHLIFFSFVGKQKKSYIKFFSSKKLTVNQPAEQALKYATLNKENVNCFLRFSKLCEAQLKIHSIFYVLDNSM